MSQVQPVGATPKHISRHVSAQHRGHHTWPVLVAAKLGAAVPGLGSGGGAIGDSFGIVAPPPPPLGDALGGADNPARKPLLPLPYVLTGALTLMVWPACMRKQSIQSCISVAACEQP